MFGNLIVRSDALTRKVSAPLVDERRQYLAHCAEQRMSRGTLRVKARLLLSITKYLKLADRPDNTISGQEVEKAASRCANHKGQSAIRLHSKLSRECFIAEAVGWLPFLNRFQIPTNR